MGQGQGGAVCGQPSHSVGPAVILLPDPAMWKALRPLLWSPGHGWEGSGMAVKWAGRTAGSPGSREGRSGRDRPPRPRPHRGHVGTAGRLLDGLMGIWPSREMHSSSGSWSCRLTSVMGIRPSTGLATAVTKPMPVAAQEG